MDNICCAHPWFMGELWYDWAYVEYVDVERNSRGTNVQKYYPSRFLGFDEDIQAVIISWENNLPWTKRELDFF